jgi:hypothetical protein
MIKKVVNEISRLFLCLSIVSFCDRRAKNLQDSKICLDKEVIPLRETCFQQDETFKSEGTNFCRQIPKEDRNLKKSFALYGVVLAVCVLFFGSAHVVSAGVEPSPFQPELNKLHSIELNVAAINKRLANLRDSEILPDGAQGYLEAMANQMDVLDSRLAEVLQVLPSPSLTNPYDGQVEVLFALDGIQVDSKDFNILVDKITSRMGVEPSPFKIGSINIIGGIDLHLIPILPPPPLP